MFGGIPLGGVYSVRAVRRAPDRPFAWSGVVISAIAVLGLATLLVFAILD
jgi:hypothetical protein